MSDKLVTFSVRITMPFASEGDPGVRGHHMAEWTREQIYIKVVAPMDGKMEEFVTQVDVTDNV